MRLLSPVLPLGIVLLVTLPGSPAVARQQPAPGSAEWIARQVQDRDTGRDSRFELRMRLVDRHGRERERRLTMIALRDREHGERADRLLIRFLYPTDIRGTGFLVLEHPGADDERFLYLPALGRVRRIAGAEKQESFVGTDFTYEDIGGRELADYTYAVLDADASWRAPDGRIWPAWILESRARDAGAAYPRVVSTVLKENFVIAAAESFNVRDEPVKRFEVRRLERVSGYWTALEMTMRNLRDRTQTTLEVTSAEYDVGLSPADFTRRELERGAR